MLGLTTLLESFRNVCITDAKETYDAGFVAVTDMRLKTKDLTEWFNAATASDDTTERLAKPYEDFYAEWGGTAAPYCCAAFELDDRLEMLNRIMIAFGVPLTKLQGLVDMLRDATSLHVAQTLAKTQDAKIDPKRSDLVNLVGRRFDR